MRRCVFRSKNSGECPNYGRMKKAFLKRGEWLRCAGCCQMCKKKKCETLCMEVAQISFEDFIMVTL